MPQDFYKTTPLSGFELAQKIADAKNQDEKIMLYLQHNAPAKKTAFEINSHFSQWPITSIRRSLFNLEQKGLIVQDGFAKGELGMMVGTYRVALPHEVKSLEEDNQLIPEGLAIKRIGAAVLKLWIKQNKIPFTGKRPKKFRQKDLNHAILSEFFNPKDLG